MKHPSPSMKITFRDVCRKNDCFELMQKSCDKMLECGHPCRGIVNEKKCLPCLEPECTKKHGKLKQDKDDFCSICYVASIS